jgi:hypothetical protein
MFAEPRSMVLTTFGSWPARQLRGQAAYLSTVSHWREGRASSSPGPSSEALSVILSLRLRAKIRFNEGRCRGGVVVVLLCWFEVLFELFQFQFQFR